MYSPGYSHEAQAADQMTTFGAVIWLSSVVPPPALLFEGTCNSDESCNNGESHRATEPTSRRADQGLESERRS